MTNDSDDVHATARSLLALVNDDPVQATTGCSFALQQLDKRRQEDLNHLVVVPYATALHLQSNRKAWVRYTNTPQLWAHRTRKKPQWDKDRGRVLYLVMEATFAVEMGNGYQRGWWYARALEDAFNRGIMPADLPEHIKSCGSLKAMYRRAVENTPKRPPECDENDPYFNPSDPGREPVESSRGKAEKMTADPTQHPEISTDDADDVSNDLHTRRIRHSTRLTRELDKIARTGRRKKLIVVAQPLGAEIVLRLAQKSPKKPSTSSWLGVTIQPDHPDTYYGPYHYNTSVPQIASRDRTTYKPWKT
jgi:hypothetical protein